MAFNGEIFEILSWLPAKAIFRCMSVSKSCNESTSEQYFAKIQARNMLQKNDNAFFIQQNSSQKYKGKLELHVLAGEENSCGVPCESLNFMKNLGHLLGSSNGLICCRNTNEFHVGGELFICNPAMRKWLLIPNPGRFEGPNQDLNAVLQCNVGQSDRFPCSYLLMVMAHTEFWSSDLMCKFYIPNEGIWQELGLVNLGARNIKFYIPRMRSTSCPIGFLLYAREVIFCWPYIVAFDPKKGTSRFMKIPKAARKCDFGHPNFKMGLFKWSKGNEESICLVTLSKRVFTTWAMVDYDAGLWIKINKVRALAMGMVEPDPEIAGFTVLNGDSLLIATEKRVYRYCLTGDWRGKRAEKVRENGCGANVFLYPYSNTLRTCGDGMTHFP
ncbi:hypothetical protein RHSIM_Rhsim09G0015300 [Rhododendron simsii]|uniref:F-box domain-containing protein n=1 Tax=Rhododendron simsii TaxID=118357 RepID=A0A834GIC8_RHOSS|nr:hypothetical protein RHSIM_Rhsim09G0015300 [Rhododendron simsii]